MDKTEFLKKWGWATPELLLEQVSDALPDWAISYSVRLNELGDDLTALLKVLDSVSDTGD